MQTLVVGDIHGCYFEFRSLLDKAGLGQGDVIISVGDCVDRGPETPAVLSFFKEIHQAHLIMGNHERKHVRGSHNEVRLARSQEISQIQFGDAYTAAVSFMATLPLYLDLPDVLIVHGFFEPGIPCEEQKPSVLCGTMGGGKYLQTRYDRPWYELYYGNKPLLVGHENYTGTNRPFIYQDRVFGLDTGCVTGKALTSLLLPAFQFISVPSRANHWSQMKRLYSQHNTLLKASTISKEWSEAEEKALADVVTASYQTSRQILEELQSRPGFADLKPRQQAQLFTKRVGDGDWATLLQLARLEKLNTESARKVLKDPIVLYEVVEKIEGGK
jgi:serine/threonine protein phosphatase 1